MKNTHPKKRLAKALVCGMSFALLSSLTLGGTQAFGANSSNDPTQLELDNSALSRQAATEGMVLLENNNALPVAKGNVAVFGVGSYLTVKGGTGSGAVNNRVLDSDGVPNNNAQVVTNMQGLQNAGYNITTNTDYLNALPKTGTNYASDVALNSTTVQPTAATDTALYFVARNSGEGSDRTSPSQVNPSAAQWAVSYLLSPQELANIQLIGQTYKNVVVVLNVGAVVDTAWFKTINASVKDPSGGQAIDGLLLESLAGEQTGNAMADVVSGAVSPSGKTVDTWASNYWYYPASATFANNDGTGNDEVYNEGIYDGYRYFDSFYKTIAADPTSVVNYPFGYGLSYSSFDIQTQSVVADSSKITVTARVTNTGKATGKEVVEVYYSAPFGVLDKPYQELGGYVKTDDLAPGESQVVTVTFNTADMASYDEATSSYILDPGQYLIRVGNSSRNTTVAAKMILDKLVVTADENSELDGADLPNELVANPLNFYSYASEAAQIASAPTISLAASTFTTKNNRSPYEQNQDVTPADPYYQIDGTPISETTAYVPVGQTNWENTGAPYQAKDGEKVQSVTTSPTNTLYDVAKGNISMEQFVAGLSAEQLGYIVEGESFRQALTETTSIANGTAGYTTSFYQNLGIPEMALSDGPAGLRITNSWNDIAAGQTLYQWTTAWPIGTSLAQTWNTPLINAVGKALGQEMLEFGVTLWLAPGMDLHRDPLNGRNFEYYSEDPLVTGLSAAAMTSGVQSNPGVGVTVKHFAGNDQETRRQGGNNVESERTLRELTLRGFQIVVEQAQPMALMSSYNRINGTYNSQNYDLLTDVLRGEWGYKGLVMTDWGGAHATGSDTAAVTDMYAGNDLVEPGSGANDAINAIIDWQPKIDVWGLPVLNQYFGSLTANTVSNLWWFDGLTPSSTGTTSITTTVNQASITAGKVQTVFADSTSRSLSSPTYTTVQQAYADALNALSSTTARGLSAAQIAAITLTPVTTDPVTNAVTSYTVTIKGNMATTAKNMRLGDLQRSAMNILNIAMQSAPFAELAAQQGVTGITTVTPYTEKQDLVTWVSTTKSAVQAASNVVTADLRGGSSVVKNTAASYTVSISNAKDVGTVTVSLTADGAYLNLTSATGLNGFTVINPLTWTNIGGSMYKGTVTLAYPNFVSNAGPLDIVNISGLARDQVGSSTVTLSDFVVTGNLNGKSDYLPSAINTSSVTTSVTEKAPVYSIYDLNHDGAVDILDTNIAVLFYQATSSDPGWATTTFDIATAQNADVNGDGVVNLGDLVAILAHYAPSYNLFP